MTWTTFTPRRKRNFSWYLHRRNYKLGIGREADTTLGEPETVIVQYNEHSIRIRAAKEGEFGIPVKRPQGASLLAVTQLVSLMGITASEAWPWVEAEDGGYTWLVATRPGKEEPMT